MLRTDAMIQKVIYLVQKRYLEIQDFIHFAIAMFSDEKVRPAEMVGRYKALKIKIAKKSAKPRSIYSKMQ